MVSVKDLEKKRFVVATHEVLFEQKSKAAPDVERCDACGDALTLPGDEGDTGYALAGRGRYLWTRGEERRAEEPPLCPSCAAAIGIAALHHWNIEEEEG